MKPAFWTDSRIAAMPAPVRLFYIGLWMQADDTGWLRWDVPQIAAELYAFDATGRRERNVSTWGDILEEGGRIKRHPCGHAFIPTMTDHQRMSAATKRVKTVEREHQGCPAVVRGDPVVAGGSRPVGNVSPTGTDAVNGNVTDSVAPARAPRGAAAAEDWSDRIEEMAARGRHQ